MSAMPLRSPMTTRVHGRTPNPRTANLRNSLVPPSPGTPWDANQGATEDETFDAASGDNEPGKAQGRAAQDRFYPDEWFLGPRPKQDAKNDVVRKRFGSDGTDERRRRSMAAGETESKVQPAIPDLMPDLMTVEQDSDSPLPASLFDTDGIWRYAQALTARPQNAGLLRGDPPSWTLMNAIKNSMQAADGVAPQKRENPVILSGIEEQDSYAGIKSAFRFCWTLLLPIGTTLLCPPLTPVVAMLQYAFSSPQDQISTCLVTATSALLGLPPLACPNALADYVLESAAAESTKHLLFNEDAKAEQPTAAPAPADSVPVRVPHTAAVASATPAPHQTLDEFICAVDRMAQRYR